MPTLIVKSCGSNDVPLLSANSNKQYEIKEILAFNNETSAINLEINLYSDSNSNDYTLVSTSIDPSDTFVLSLSNSISLDNDDYISCVTDSGFVNVFLLGETIERR